MKSHIATPLLLALLWLAALPCAFAQNLPSSMAHPDTAITRAPASDSQNLLVAGNSLVPENPLGFDLGRIPAAPENVVRRIGGTGAVESAQATATVARATAGNSIFWHSAVLLGTLAIAILATHERPEHHMHADISDLRGFPKKRLAHREAHA